MGHKITTQWKGNMLFESDNPSGHTVLNRYFTRKWRAQ